MWSVKLDSVELVNAIYNLSTVLDDTTPEKEINVIETAGIDGAVLVDSRFGSKTIKLAGVLVGSSASDLQGKIDTLNELFARKDKNFDVIPTSGLTRRYVVNLIGSVFYDRKYYMNDYVKWSAKLFVGEGVGKDTSVTTDYSETVSIGDDRQPTPSGSDTLTFGGSAKPKPTLKFTLNTIGKLDLITINDDDNSKQMKIEIDEQFATSDIIKVNLDEETVKKETSGVDTVLPFRGEFPAFEIGDNNVHFDFQGATYIEDQTQTGNSSGTIIGNNGALIRIMAQSFIPSESGWFSRQKIYAQKAGTPGSLQIRVYSDNGGRPDQNLVSGATGFLEPESSFGGSGVEVTLDDSSPDYYLRAGVKYWLIITTTNSSGNYYTLWGSGTTDNYADGELLKYDGSVTPPTDPADWEDFTGTIEDLYFKTYQGQGGSPDWQIPITAPYTKHYL